MLQPRLVKFSCTILLFFSALSLPGQPASVLSEGSWYRMAVTETGVYQLSGAFLQEQGIDLSSVQLEQTGIFGYGGGMLPQALTDKRYSDLPENHIFISGGEDGRLDPEDQIIFYARGADREAYQLDANGNYQFDYQKNLYADTAYYFLTFSMAEGLRVSARSSRQLSEEVITTFDDYWVHEEELFNILEPGSGREWYGENFYHGDRLDFSPPLEGMVHDKPLQLWVQALGRTTAPSSLVVLLNGEPTAELALPAILSGTYTEKGKEADLALMAEMATDKPEISLRYRAEDGRGRAHLNRILLQYSRRLARYGVQTRFRSLASLTHTQATYQVADAEAGDLIWDITDPLHPLMQEARYREGALRFSVAQAGQLREFVVFDPQALPVPTWQGEEASHQLPTGQVPELLIVTPPSLIPAAERLAKLRRSHDQLEVAVATTADIYRQYASGRQDISAIRNYAKDLYDAGNGKLRYLLLFGKASYDYKNRIEGNINLVPTYQSRNSIHPIYSYPSDDYYGFLEDEEGYWEESFRGDHTLDIGVGRLPVKDLQEAEQVVDKLELYAKSNASLGDWRTFITFLADDGDNDRYQKDSEQLAAQVSERIQGVNTRKIYLDAYEQERFPNQELAPAVNRAVEEVIEKGTLLFNYVGHGNEQRLADENVLNVGMIRNWKNADRLPFFVTATCEFGRYDDPERISGAERLVLLPKGGAIGMVTTARPVFSNTNYLLNEAFYRYVFAREEGEFPRIGDVFRKTKNDALNGRDNRNFSLLADPSMRLAYPRYRIVIDSILSANSRMPVDTVRALEEVRVFGRIVGEDGRESLRSFDGELSLVLHDKAYTVQTRGNEGTVMQFQETDNVINRVRARVERGMFSVDLLVPKNINYQQQRGRISMYARAAQSLADAFGGMDSLYIGGSLPAVEKDNLGPRLQLFINDTTFRDGGLSGSDPVLIAHFRDEQGINLSEQQLGHEIRAVLRSLEGDQAERSYLLNDFYQSGLNDFRTGRLQYPLGSLEEGKYMLTLYAWDTHNNPASASLMFWVRDEEKLRIQNLANYPNPFARASTFSLEHNRAGQDLQVILALYDMSGSQLFRWEKDFPEAGGRLTVLDWQAENDLTGKLAPGVYLVRVRLRSPADGQEDVQNLRIIVTN